MNQVQAATQNAPKAALVRPAAPLTQARTTILLVEDEAFVREVTCELLECEGFRVLKAKSAIEARTIFRYYGKIVRLLLTDVVLPGQNGRDLARDLRGLCPSLTTIFISGYPENSVTRDGLTDDGMFYLPKPFSAESLLSKVKQVLGQEQPPV